jgi:hypothetical protein
MQRLIMDNLIAWKDDPYKKPLLLRGISGCGKTYLLKDFASKFYEDVLYLDLEEDIRVTSIFQQDLRPDRIIKDLSIYRGSDIKPGKTLLIFDNIHSCGRALDSLRHFSDEAQGFHIIAAGSFIDATLPKVETLTLYPMNFYEFMLAQNSMLAKHLKENPFKDETLITFKAQLEELFRDFQITGGMPEVVKCWIDTKSIDAIDKVQSRIISSFENAFTKYAPISLFPKLSAIWNAIPAQLTKDNRKFIFSQVKKSWRAKDLEDALYWLIRAGLVYKVKHIDKPGFPLSGHVNHTHFKLYMCDVGLLRRTARIPTSAMFDNSEHSGLIKGAIAENIVCCELVRMYEDELYYWSAENPGRAEVEFVIQDGNDIIPIACKAGSASRTRSLLQYTVRFSPKKSVLTSMDNGKPDVLPLYVFWNLKEWLSL